MSFRSINKYQPKVVIIHLSTRELDASFVNSLESYEED